MTSPISPFAREYVRSRAAAVMSYECRAERIMPGSHDDTTLLYTTGAAEVLYEGICRIWEVNGANAVAMGEGVEIDMQTTQLSMPYDAPLLKKNDEVLILNGPVQDTTMVGKRFQIQSSARAGELRATRRYDVTVVQ